MENKHYCIKCEHHIKDVDWCKKNSQGMRVNYITGEKKECFASCFNHNIDGDCKDYEEEGGEEIGLKKFDPTETIPCAVENGICEQCNNTGKIYGAFCKCIIGINLRLQNHPFRKD